MHPEGAAVTQRFGSLEGEGTARVAEVAEVAAPWIVAASRPFADWYFGEPAVAEELLREWMLRPDSELYVGRAFVAYDGDGAVTGAAIAMTGSELARCRAADFTTFCAELGSGPDADAAVDDVVRASRELFLPVVDDDVYVSRVGVDPTHQGRGIARALIGHAIAAFRSQGVRRCRLDVSADNEAAIRAYRAAGLEVAATSFSPTARLTYCAMTAPV